MDGNDIGQLFRTLAEESAYHYPDTEEGKKQIIRDYQQVIDYL